MIIDNGELAAIREQAKDETIALRLGCYDLLHPGHQRGIDFAARLAEKVVIGVMPDSRARRKGPDRPVNPEVERVQAIDNAEHVTYSFIYPESIIALTGSIWALRPNVYVEDEENEHNWPKRLLLRGLGIPRVIDRVSRTGSTSLMIATFGVEEAKQKSGLTQTVDPSTIGYLQLRKNLV